MKYELSEEYESSLIGYPCKPEGKDVDLIAIYYLTNDQGGEGQLFPASTKVVCSSAKNCSTHKNGLCPLTKGYGVELNKLKIVVMEDSELSEIKPGLYLSKQAGLKKGQYIWFGKTSVFSDVESAKA